MSRFLLLALAIPTLIFGDAELERALIEKQLEAEKLLEADWFKETLRESISKSEDIDLSEIKERNEQILKGSKPCFSQGSVKEQYETLVFISFSAPISLWKEYSESLERVGGAFAVRGLPDDSFKSFAQAMESLRKQGVRAPIVLNPKLFEKYQVDSYPEIVLTDGEHFDKVAGSVTLSYALETFSKQGDSDNAGEILQKLKGNQ